MEKERLASALKPCEGGLTLVVSVQPRARQNAIVGVHAGALKVSVSAPPVDGKANRALGAFIAGCLGVSKRSVTLVAGHLSRHKRLEVEGLSLDQAVARLCDEV